MVKSVKVIISVMVVCVMAIAMLNSCGKNNPIGTSVQTISTTQPPINMASTAMGVQSTLTSVTITVDPNIKKKYKLYYSEAATSSASIKATQILSTSNPNVFQLDVKPDTNYLFALFEVNDKGYPIGLIALLNSSLDQDKTGRIDFYLDQSGSSLMNISPDMLKVASSTPSMISPSSCANCPSPAKSSYLPVLMNMLSSLFEPVKAWAVVLSGSGMHPAPQPESAKWCGWHFIVGKGSKITQSTTGTPPFPGSSFTQVVTVDYTWYVNHPQGYTKSYETLTATYTWISIVKPDLSVDIFWSYDNYAEPWIFYTACIPVLQSIDVTPANKTLKIGEQVLYKAKGNFKYDDNTTDSWWLIPWWKLSDGKVASIFAWYDGAHVTGVGPGTTSIIAEHPDNKGNVVKGEAKLTVESKKLEISPKTATIYIHHSDPKKREQQYKATYGTDDVTKQVSWSVSGINIAYIGLHNGLATGNKLGTVEVMAVNNYGEKADPPAKLCVECWEYKYIMQNDSQWYDKPYANYANPTFWMYDIGNKGDKDYRQIYYGTIGGTGCLTTDIAMILTTIGIETQPDIFDRTLLKDGYYDGNNIRPKTLADYSNGIIKSSYYTSKSATDIKAELDKCNFVAVAIPSSKGDGVHWVLVTGYEKGTDTFYIKNPANNNKTSITSDTIDGGDVSVLVGTI